MAKIRFPVIKAKPPVFPKKPLCPWCKKEKVYEPHAMAILNAGALRRVRRGAYLPGKDLYGFVSLTWHGDDTDDHYHEYTSIDIVEKSAYGQFELYFCSTDCLRAFFNYCVDELERNMEEFRRKHYSDNPE